MSEQERGAPGREYVPMLALPYWVHIGPFVRESVNEAVRLTGRSERDLYAALTPLVLWSWQTRGLALERSRIFRRSVVDQFVHLGMENYARGSQATHRAALWRMVEVLNPDEESRARRPIGRSEPTTPYNETEVAALASWAQGQRTEGRRLSASALLALGLGAGLATRELLAVRSDDIVSGAAGTLIRVRSDRERTVPLLRSWERMLDTAMHESMPGGWVFRPGRKNTADGQVTDFLTRSRTTLDIRPSRMRSTWLVGHLDDGTSPQELLRISGLKNLAALDKLTKFVL
jgi:integrase